jgi:beta-phosphoglucomutase-like phosphatase (HAD superfamily)
MVPPGSSSIDAVAVEMLLCDADDCLYPSEGLAFEAATGVANRLLAELGSDIRFTPTELRVRAAGRNFRSIAAGLADLAGAPLSDADLERWVAAERSAVIGHLRENLRPDETVRGPLRRLATRLRLAAVSSSALARLDACFAATGLDDLLPAEVRVSAEDSLAEPTSKPDPAVYGEAGRRFEVSGSQALAIEDSISGARAAVGAGFPTVGLLQFVPPQEREERAAALTEVGATVVLDSWSELETLLAPSATQSRRADSNRGPLHYE